MKRGILALVLVFLALRPVPAAADIPYKTEFAGVDDKQLLKNLRAASELVTLADRKPASETALSRRAASDRDRLDAVLRAAGYYDAEIGFDIDFESKPAIVHVNIVPGARYALTDVGFVTPDGGTPPLPDRLTPQGAGLEIGAPARAAPIVAAEGRIVQALTENGYPLAKVVNRRAVIDKATKTMTVTYTVDAGAPARFGMTEITGIDRVDPDYMGRRIAWHEGEPYDSRLVETTRKNLVSSGLFATARVVPGDTVGPDGRIPVTIDITERPRRSVGVGLKYDTALGASATGYWEHRNLFGDGERLRVTGEAGQSRQGVTGAFRRPDFLSLNQDLLANLTTENETLDAYDRRRVLFFTGIERRLTDTIAGGGGVQIERTHIDQRPGTLDYTAIGTPLFLRRDDTDNLLDPTRGSRQALLVTPYIGALGSDLTFVSSRLSGSAYQRLDEDARFVLAGFAAIGSILGESRDGVPKDKRLYAGGGGSVRGYGYQKAGPLDANGDPIGGRSSLELGAELRIKITETIGIVPFLEAGNVYESSFPGGKLLYGTGLGVRYYTPIGPVRFDVGVPLNKRPEDDSFQIYVSLGQAF